MLKSGPFSELKGIPMSQALTDEGCAIVRTFLRTLVTLSKQEDEKPNVGKFLKLYREINAGFRKHVSDKFIRTATCGECGTVFDTSSNKGKFCSSKCSTRNYRRRKRERRAI